MDLQKKELMELVGARIKYFRHIRSLSQEELAFQANLNPAYFGQVERGIKCPTIDTLYKISKALGVILPELLRIETGPAPERDVPLNRSADNFTRINELLSSIPTEKQSDIIEILEKIIRLL